MESIKQDIKALLSEADRVLVAIDGMSASGKTTLAGELFKAFDCNVFHMDDFFLPEKLKTPDRLSQVGGNVDYLRFKTEVADKLTLGEPFTYRVYDCKKGEFSQTVFVMPKRLNIVEGAYSLHPSFSGIFDYKILMKIESRLQRSRIAQRNGSAMLSRFLGEWIPKENEYFERFNIESRCDRVIHIGS